MSNDSVSVAFELILEEIGSVVSEVNSQGAAFMRNGEYEKAEKVIASGRKLGAFVQKLEALNQEWQSGLDEPTRRQVQIAPTEIARTIASAPKSPKTRIVVKFPDGAVLFEGIAAQTFAKALNKLGLQQVSNLGIKVNGYPLVSKQRSEEYKQTEIDGFLIMTHSSTESKRKTLLDVASSLNVELSVDVVPA